MLPLQSWLVAAVASLTGISTHMRADPTDLLALPALYAAWWVHRSTVTRPKADLRSSVASVTGVALLPLGVLATAATSQDCSGNIGLDAAIVLSGTFTGQPGVERRVIVGGDFLSNMSVDAAGTIRPLPQADLERMPDGIFLGYDDRSACDSAGTCWRLGGSAAASIEISHDGGKTWTTDYEMSEAEAKAAIKDVELPCDNEPKADAQALAVFDGSNEAHVVVAVSHAGILLRSADGQWRRVSAQTLEDLPVLPEPPPSPIIELLEPSLPPAE